MTIRSLQHLPAVLAGCLALAGSLSAAETMEILTPPPPPTPRINGPTIFGVRPHAPFLYTIPVTGDRPITYSVDALPDGLTVDPATGRITGKIAAAGEYPVVFRATNALGAAEKKFRIVCGDRIALTPPLGWNSWNSWAGSVDQDKVLRSARALVSSGLADHGWTYVNIDDTWQGERGGPHHAILGNEKFPDMKQLCDDVHALGLKIGIYSSPWITTYAGYRGGSSDDAQGSWQKLKDYEPNKRIGAFEFAGGFFNLLAGDTAIFELEELGLFGGGFFQFPVLRMVRSDRFAEISILLFADEKFVIDDDFVAAAGHLPTHDDLGLPAHA